MPFDKEVQNLLTAYSSPPAGSFSIVINGPDGMMNTSWETCRERFGISFKEDNETILLSAQNHLFVSKFLDRTEAILRIGGCEVGPSVCGSTNHASIMFINPSKFWRECYMKRSFLTIILRAGIYYDGNDYQAALKAQEYFRAAENAALRFLFGFTKYTGSIPTYGNPSQGWVYFLGSRQDDEIRNLLVKPNKVQPSLIGSGSLWS